MIQSHDSCFVLPSIFFSLHMLFSFQIEPNGLSTSQISVRADSPDQQHTSSGAAAGAHTNESSTDDDVVGFVPSAAKSGAISYVRRSSPLCHLNFDDSFKKRATVETRMDKANPDQDPEAAVTDIFVPVPTQLASHENTINEHTLHDTIQSTYQTNLSLNKLFAERHKPSLALFGRALGSKQRELEKQKSAASLIVSSFAAFVPVSILSTIYSVSVSLYCCMLSNKSTRLIIAIIAIW